MATAIKTSNFGDYTKAALAAANLKANFKKLYDLLEPSEAHSGRDLDGSPGPGASPEFDRIDPISRATLRKELLDLYDASTDANFGTSTNFDP